MSQCDFNLVTHITPEVHTTLNRCYHEYHSTTLISDPQYLLYTTKYFLGRVKGTDPTPNRQHPKEPVAARVCETPLGLTRWHFSTLTFLTKGSGPLSPSFLSHKTKPTGPKPPYDLQKCSDPLDTRGWIGLVTSF